MPGGRKKYKSTENDIRVVEGMAGVGMTHDAIARAIGVSEKTLRKHFRRELDTSADKANTKVGVTMYQLAVSGKCPSATQFWLKTRCGWRESDHSGPSAPKLMSVGTARAMFESAAASRPSEDPDEKPIQN